MAILIPQAEYTFRPIGIIRSAARHRFEAPRQAVYAHAGAFLEWTDPAFLVPAAADLAGFDRVWLVWVFDRNPAGRWHPKVRVPVPAEQDRYSVLATRSPYRPNPIGLSAVELREVASTGLELGPCDLLDGTPVLDVKPYIPDVDAFPEARAGWRDRVERERWQVAWGAEALARARFILDNGGPDLENFSQVQLAWRPADATRKRVTAPDVNGCYRIGCRTWQLEFTLDEAVRMVSVGGVFSHYRPDELAPDAPDPYGDKALHRRFRRCWPE